MAFWGNVTRDMDHVTRSYFRRYGTKLCAVTYCKRTVTSLFAHLPVPSPIPYLDTSGSSLHVRFTGEMGHLDPFLHLLPFKEDM